MSVEETAVDIHEDPEAERQRWLARAKNQQKKQQAVRINKKANFDLSALEETNFAPPPSSSSKSSWRARPKQKNKKNEVDDLLSNLANFGVPEFPEASLPSINVNDTEDLFAKLNAANNSSGTSDLPNVTAESLLASLNGFDDGSNTVPNAKENSETDLASLLDSPGEIEAQKDNYNNNSSSNNDIGESRAAWNLLSLFGKKPSSSSPSKEGPKKTTKATGTLKYGIKEDMNKNGLKKVKKPQIKYGGKGKAKLQMEDTNCVELPFIEEKRGFFAVFDGHVDKNAAVSAKSLFPREFERQIRKIKNFTECKDLTEVFRTTFYRVDSQMSEFEFEGTTATVAFVWQAGEDRYLQVGNVGDSTAFLCRNGQAVWLSVDHKVTEPSEIARMKEGGFPYSEGQTRINGLAVSRALGDHFVKQNNLGVIVEPYICEPYKLGPQDSFIIVASDGLWDAMTGQEAVDLVKDMDSPDKMARKLVLTALHNPKCNDNITVIVIHL